MSAPAARAGADADPPHPPHPPHPPRRATSRRRRGARWLLFGLVLGTSVAILTTVVYTSALLGEITDDVATAQRRATTLSTAQREALKLSAVAADVDERADEATLQVQRGLLARQLQVAIALFPADSPQAAELVTVRADLLGADWSGVGGAGAKAAARRTDLVELVRSHEVRVKRLYDEQEKLFYTATIESLGAKRASENALLGLLILAAGLGIGWAVGLKRRARSDLARAYDALVAEMADRRALQERLARQAFHDSLTGLPNRFLLLNRLTAALAADDAEVAVVLVDLDGFKEINDTLGHTAGDELLSLAAARLASCVRATDTAARLGGDEFAVLVNGETATDALAVAHRMVDAVKAPFSVAGTEIMVSLSVGVAHHVGPAAGSDPAVDLLRNADIAMYAAKRSGKNRVEEFCPSLLVATTERALLKRQLVTAVARGEISVHFQPIVDLRTGEIRAVEALARWPQKGQPAIIPDLFIPLAEESGVITEIGRQLLHSATAAAAAWRTSIPCCENLVVAVNASGHQIQRGDIAADVAAALAASGLPPTALALEITESILLEDTASAAAQFRRLKESGVLLALDDFGTGYSSLASLMNFSVDILKIDRSFLLNDSPRGDALVRTVADLGRVLGLLVVAEGAESAAHLALARDAGCHAAQGFYLSGPMPPDEMALFLHRAAATGHLAKVVEQTRVSTDAADGP